MAKNSKISWTDHTGNPWIGCTVAHTGCLNCYARTASENKAGKTPGPWAFWGKGKDRLVTKGFWTDVFAWAKAARKAGVRRTLFASMMDPLDPEVYERATATRGVAYRATFNAYMNVLDNVAAEPGQPGLVPLLLTKRPENWRWIPEHVRRYCWLLYSASDQPSLDAGMPNLLAAEGFAGLGLSLEPLVGPIDMSGSRCSCISEDCPLPRSCEARRGNRLGWVIIGGESGPKARPCNIEWIRSLVRQCREAGVAPYVKQLGARASDPVNGLAGALLDVPADAAALISRRLRHKAGTDPAEWPEDLRVQEFPKEFRR